MYLLSVNVTGTRSDGGPSRPLHAAVDMLRGRSRADTGGAAVMNALTRPRHESMSPSFFRRTSSSCYSTGSAVGGSGDSGGSGSNSGEEEGEEGEVGEEGEEGGTNANEDEKKDGGKYGNEDGNKGSRAGKGDGENAAATAATAMIVGGCGGGSGGGSGGSDLPDGGVKELHSTTNAPLSVTIGGGDGGEGGEGGDGGEGATTPNGSALRELRQLLLQARRETKKRRESSGCTVLPWLCF